MTSTAAAAALVKQKVARVVYRNVLRASNFGRYPHVLGEYGSQVLSNNSNNNETISEEETRFTPSLTASSPREIKSIIKHVFQNDNAVQNDDALKDLFAVMRRANSLAPIWQPTLEGLPKFLPIFDYSHGAAFIGETVEFNLFEPRYKKLVRLAMMPSQDDGTESATTALPTGFILLRSRPFLQTNTSSDKNDSRNFLAVTTLLQIQNHSDLSGDQIVVQCMGGPRVQVLDEQEVEIMEGDDKMPSLQVATRFTLEHDIAFDFSSANDSHDGIASNPTTTETKEVDNYGSATSQLMEDRKKCLQLLQKVTPMENIASTGMWPPLDPEPFSFWALQFVMAQHDVQARHQWLAVRSTQRRLNYVNMLLDEHAARIDHHDEQRKPSDATDKEPEK